MNKVVQQAAATSNVACTQLDVRERYTSVRRLTEDLCEPLSAEDQMVQSMPDASPAKWHQAHTTWFFETFILLSHAPNYRPFDERYTFLFNSYYKSLRDGHPVRAQRGLWSRPSLHDVKQYRRYVDEQMIRLLDSGAAKGSDAMFGLLELGLNHEQQHQELIVTDIKHALWSNPLRPAYRDTHAMPHDPAVEQFLAPPLPATGPTFATDAMQLSARETGWFDFAGGIHSIGHGESGFAFDNETPQHKVLLQPFRLASRLVTNADYMKFMNDGGYSRPELWLSEGWDTVNAQNWRAPLYWEKRGDDWVFYTLNGERPVDPAEPVSHVSYLEADAYARWTGARLPTEFEWEVAACRVVQQFAAPFKPTGGLNWEPNFVDSGRLHPAPARLSTGYPAQLFGDVWEWTASQYLPYPGFHPAAGAVGEYNGKFMCNQFVLRGGSCATPPGHIRATYRNFFPPHARWQFSGIRLAHD